MNFAPQVREDFERIKWQKVKGKYTHKYIEDSQEIILKHTEGNESSTEAYLYYQATFKFTEHLREVLKNLRLSLL